MTFYYDFDGRRWHATVFWPANATTLNVELTDTRIIRQFPSDFIFELKRGNKISYTIEDPANKRLCELQKAVGKRLQEFANQLA